VSSGFAHRTPEPVDGDELITFEGPTPWSLAR
jgi:hypothetical protein